MTGTLANDMGQRNAVFIDFGGVLTTSLFDAFKAFGAAIGPDPKLPMRVLAEDPVAAALLVEHEEGRLDDEAFEVGFAERLAAHGAPTEAEGLIARMQSGLKPDPKMVALVEDLRRDGRPVALVSNSLGRNCYAGFDLDQMFDAVVISGAVGIRKPSRGIYEIACQKLGVTPDEAIMIDDFKHNLEGAQRLGIAGILHTDAETTRQSLGDLLTPLAAAQSEELNNAV